MDDPTDDTDPWAAEMQIKLFREATPQRRLEVALGLSAAVWNASRAAIDRAYPEETQDERDRRFLSVVYEPELAAKFIAYRQRVLGPRNGRLKA